MRKCEREGGLIDRPAQPDVWQLVLALMRDDAAYGIADSTNPRMILLAWGRVALAMLTLFGVWPPGRR